MNMRILLHLMSWWIMPTLLCKWATSCRDNVERFQERARDNKEMTKCTLSALPMYSLSLAMVSGYSWVEGWYSNSITI